LTGYVARQPIAGLDEALTGIRHRGPDARGQWSGREADWHVGLGHVRLSIIDLSEAANQPFTSPDGAVVLV
jgi:asparagine synthase (glutamine-hydrolysing)